MRSNTILLFLIAFAFAGCSVKTTVTKESTVEKSTSSTVEEKIFKDVKYGEFDRNVMDICLPKNRTPNTVFVLNIHGGAWTQGDKKFDDQLAEYLLQQGIAVANINYRYADLENTHLPQLLDDVGNAFQYLKNHADEWNTRKSGFSITGASSGAHVSLMYAYTRDSGIKAIVERCGPVDFRDEQILQYVKTMNAIELIDKMSGNKTVWNSGGPIPEKYIETSPAKWVKPIPTMIIHGDKDEVVPVQQAYLLESELKKKGAPNQLVIIEGAGHHIEKLAKDQQTEFKHLTEWLKKYGSN